MLRVIGPARAGRLPRNSGVCVGGAQRARRVRCDHGGSVGVTCRDSRERTRGWDGFCPRSTRKCSWDRRGRAGPPSASNPAKFGPGLRHDSVNASRRVRAAFLNYAPGLRAGACRASPSKFRGVWRSCPASQEGAVRPRRVRGHHLSRFARANAGLGRVLSEVYPEMLLGPPRSRRSSLRIKPGKIRPRPAP